MLVVSIAATVLVLNGIPLGHCLGQGDCPSILFYS